MKLLPTEYVQTSRGRKYVLFKNDVGVTDMTRRGGVFEHHLFDWLNQNLKLEGRTIIDVGANFGFHTVEFAFMVGDKGKVISFEPQRHVYHQLCGNVILNGLPNVICHQNAVGHEIKGIWLENVQYYDSGHINIGNTHVDRCTGGAKEWVEMVTLDSFSFASTHDIAAIKIDVQGYEPFVLDGAAILLKSRPILLIELEEPQLKLYEFTVADMLRKLDGFGYKAEKIIDAPHLCEYVCAPK